MKREPIQTASHWGVYQVTNVVTDDKGTSRLGQSSVAQTALIEVERIHALPDLTAYDLPQFARKDDELWALAESA